MDLHATLDDMILLVGRKLRERNICLEKRYAANLPRINAVEDQIKQVILNLIRNAEEAIPDGGGEIVVATKAFAGCVQIEVRDTGTGIPPENLKRVFNQFFTTKKEGTGLGLSISHEIIKSHGGNIEVASQPGTGTVFTVSIPISGEPLPS